MTHKIALHWSGNISRTFSLNSLPDFGEYEDKSANTSLSYFVLLLTLARRVARLELSDGQSKMEDGLSKSNLYER